MTPLLEAPAGRFQLILLDALSSDAVPTHLLTREALAVYAQRLLNHGVLAFHISNSHLDLQKMLVNLAADAGWICLVCHDIAASTEEFEQDMQAGKYDSVYAVMARQGEHLHGLENLSGWKTLSPDESFRVWTDDYSNPLEVVKWWR